MILNEIFDLNEAHYTDTFPKSFDDFRSKYLKVVRLRQHYNLYVQFSFKDNAMDRTAWSSPDHHDPVGNYGYPLEYVLSHPSDIWYGKGAPYLRVLQNTAKRTLQINKVDSLDQVIRIIRAAGFSWDEAEQMLTVCKKVYKGRIQGGNKFGKLLLQAMQVDILGGPTGEDTGWGRKQPQYRIRSGDEQSALFLKAGFDAIEDTSKNASQAVINDREPQQIIFLNRAAFRVIDVFSLRPGVERNRLPSMTHSSPDEPLIERPFVAKIANMMDDSITGGAERSSLNGWSYYWTKKGRRIEIRFTLPSSYYDRALGSKRHKENKLADQYEPSIIIRSEIGMIEAEYESATKFKDIIADLALDWNKLVANPETTSWTPQTRQDYFKAEEAKRQQHIQSKIDAENRQMIAETPQFLEQVSFMAKYWNLPFEPNADADLNMYLMKACDGFTTYLRRNGKDEDAFEGAIAFAADDFTAPRLKPLQPQWEMIERIIRKAFKDQSGSDSFWWVSSGGHGMFKGMAAIALGKKLHEM